MLILLAATLLADISLPLGRFARPGVPVLMDGKGEVTIDGWAFTIDGPTLVHPPRLPFRVSCSPAAGGVVGPTAPRTAEC